MNLIKNVRVQCVCPFVAVLFIANQLLHLGVLGVGGGGRADEHLNRMENRYAAIPVDSFQIRF